MNASDFDTVFFITLHFRLRFAYVISANIPFSRIVLFSGQENSNGI